ARSRLLRPSPPRAKWTRNPDSNGRNPAAGPRHGARKPRAGDTDGGNSVPAQGLPEALDFWYAITASHETPLLFLFRPFANVRGKTQGTRPIHSCRPLSLQKPQKSACRGEPTGCFDKRLLYRTQRRRPGPSW